MFRFGFHPSFILITIILLLIVGLFCFGLIKLFLKVNKKQRLALISIIALCTALGVGWFLPIGTLTGTWQLSSGFSASPRNIRPAPQKIQLLNDGIGIKIDHDGYEIDFEWHITTFEELALSTRPGSYIVRLYGFGTRLAIQNSLRGEWPIGRFDLPQDYRAVYRRSFRN